MQFHFVAKENVMTKAKSFLVLAIAATAMLASLLEFADARAGERAGEKEESMGLRTVMKELGRNMEAVTGAISREAWALVEELRSEERRVGKECGSRCMSRGSVDD